MYYVNKTCNSILKVPWFNQLPTPAYNSSWNRHDNMGMIAKWKLVKKNSFRFFRPSPDILTNHNIKKTASRRNIWGSFYIPKGEGLGGVFRRRKMICNKKTSIYTLTPIIYAGMYNYHYNNLLQYIFEQEPTKIYIKYLPDVWLKDKADPNGSQKFQVVYKGNKVRSNWPQVYQWSIKNCFMRLF